MVIRRKAGLLEEIEFKRPPVIYLQVWDKDMITRDEYLAAFELNLSNMPLPYPSAHLCKPYPPKRKRINLFKRKVIQGWFPIQNNSNPSLKVASKDQNVSGWVVVFQWLFVLHLKDIISGQNAAADRGLHGCGGFQPAGRTRPGSTNGLGATIVGGFIV